MNTTTCRNRQYRRRGSGQARGLTMVIVVGALSLLITMTVVVLSVTTGAIRANRKQQSASAALSVAESGAELGALWLKDRPYPPTGTAAIVPTIPAAPSGTSYSVQVVPDSDNPTQFLKIYKIVSIGTVGAESRTVEVVVRQSSFGKYAYFTDRETSTGGSAIWWNSKDKIDGPVHSNNRSGTNFNINYSGWSSNTPRRPIFLDQVTGSGTSISYSPSRPTTETDYQKVFLNGSKGYKLGVDPISLPSSTSAQKEAAWGGSSGFPSTNGVYMRAGSGGGIYIRGDCTIAMSVDASGNQRMTVGQSSNTTVITFDKTAGTTSVTGPVGTGSPTSATSFSNGVIYCTGHITSLRGTLADNKVTGGAIVRRSEYTIATDTNAGKDITISGDIVYNTRPDKTMDASASANLLAGTLGLVAQDIKIADDGTTAYNHPPREINAVMMAGSSTVDGSISVNNYNRGSTSTLKVIGGLIQSTRGAVGTISGGVMSTGYAKDYNYDPRLASNPPPFYPTTGQYDRMSWKVLPN